MTVPRSTGITATPAVVKAALARAVLAAGKVALARAVKLSLAAAMRSGEARTLLAAGKVGSAAAMRSGGTRTLLTEKLGLAARARDAVTTQGMARVVLPARARPIDIDSLHAPWPHFLAGHGASGGNAR